MAAVQLADLGERLAGFVERYGTRPHDWQAGVDCGLVLADWAMWLGFPDPVPHLRGIYHDADGCRAVLLAGGGLPAIVDGGLAAIGWTKTTKPETGSIAVVGSANSIQRQWGAIRSGAHWLVQTGHGLSQVVARPLTIWIP